MKEINFDIMGDFVVDHSVDHDILVSRPSRREIKQITKEELKERDIPENQLQIVEI